MSSYERLAASYDELTEDVDYQRRADFLEAAVSARPACPVHTVLDLACGTGTMTWLLTARGYELIAVDGSEDMLAAAAAKTGPGIPPAGSCTSRCRSSTCTERSTRRSAVSTVSTI